MGTTDKASPDQTSRFDPFTLWRQLYEVSERAFAGVIERAMGTSRFARVNGKVMELILASQRLTRDSTRMMMTAMNLPTREDLARLGELVIQLEEKVDQVIDRLDAAEAAAKRAPGAQPPPGDAAGTGRPPGGTGGLP